MDGSALQEETISKLDDDALSGVHGGLTVATATMPKAHVGQDVNDWATRVSRYCYAYTHGGYPA
jgi:hypothetical protein